GFHLSGRAIANPPDAPARLVQCAFTFHGVRAVSAKSRPNRQSCVRRAAYDTGRRTKVARGDSAAVVMPADSVAVHGRGMANTHTLSVFHRFSRRARRRRTRGTPQ